MVRILSGVILLLAPAAVAAAEPPKDGPTTIKLTVAAAPAAPRALKYRLLPDPLDVTPGDAAPTWLRAGQSAIRSPHKWTDAEYEWLNVPLKELPRKEVQALLDEFREALRLADQAARRDHCDWGLSPLTFQTLGDLPLGEIQECRLLATLLSLRCRLDLAEGRTDRVVTTLQTGFALARDVGNGPTLIHNLVGFAITAIMLGRLDEVTQAPTAPNFYWALADLPAPFINVRKTLEYELNSLYRSFPPLRELDKGPLPAAQAQALAEQLFEALAKFDDMEDPPPGKAKVPAKQAVAALTEKTHADARRFLIAQGRTPEQVEALPPVQAVLLYLLGQYDREKDDVQKWFSVPPWQARAGLAEIDKRLKADRERREGNVIIRLLVPTALKVHEASTRLERLVAGQRCVEAIRLYAAAHDGKLPAALADVTEAPLPLDPQTGKGFDAFYKSAGDTAVLDVPPSSGMPPVVGRRYEFTRGR